MTGSDKQFKCHKCSKSYRSKFWFSLHLKKHEPIKIAFLTILGLFFTLYGFWIQKPDVIVKSITCEGDLSECNLTIQNVGKSTTLKYWVRLASDYSPEIFLENEKIPPDEPKSINFDPFPPKWTQQHQNLFDDVTSGKKALIVKTYILYQWKFVFWDIYFDSGEYLLIISTGEQNFTRSQNLKIYFTPPTSIKGLTRT